MEETERINKCPVCDQRINTCPSCGSTNIETIDEFDPEDGTPITYMFSCDVCKADWYQKGWYGNPYDIHKVDQ